MRAMRVHPYSVAACAFEVRSGAELQLLPAGEFRSLDGRPEKIPAWRIDARIAARLIARVAARANRLVIDYEHQTLHTERNGQPAPAAGWFKTLAWREPDAQGRGGGLFATDVEWTERARAMIEAGEYRYLSPVFVYDTQTGEVLDILHAALTNNPALDGMAEVAARAAARLAAFSEETAMNELLNKLLAALGLAETTSEADALAAVTALKAKADKAEDLTAQLAAARAQAPDPAKYVPVEIMNELRDEVAALTARINDREVDDLVKEGMAAGKLLPAQEKWARELGKKDPADLRAYLETAQPIAALQRTQTGGKKPDDVREGDLTDEQLAVCKALGLDPQAYKKSLGSAQL